MQAVLNGQIGEVEHKIAELDAIRDGLKRGLLGLREEELELEDERKQSCIPSLPPFRSNQVLTSLLHITVEGIRERIQHVDERTKGHTVATSSRRRRGPAFLPSEHDDLPNGVAFMTLTGHVAPISALDFSEPYGIAVTASLDESVRLWDLTTGDEMGYLRGHRGPVKVLQVESSVCVTGGADGKIKIWDLDVAESAPLGSPTGINGGQPTSLEQMLLGKEEDPFFIGSTGGAGLVNGEGDGLMREDTTKVEKEKEPAGPCTKTLDGHTKAVTSLYFDGSCLVTGSSDSTLRQWDMTTGQCVLTMDILWAMQNPEPFTAPAPRPSYNTEKDYGLGHNTPMSSPRKSMRRETSGFMGTTSPATTTYADGSWEMYEDFVGGVQFWGYALASGTGDGCVRMWDSKSIHMQKRCALVWLLTARVDVCSAYRPSSSDPCGPHRPGHLRSVRRAAPRQWKSGQVDQGELGSPASLGLPLWLTVLPTTDLGPSHWGHLGHDSVRAPDHCPPVRLAQDRRRGRREWRTRESTCSLRSLTLSRVRPGRSPPHRVRGYPGGRGSWHDAGYFRADRRALFVVCLHRSSTERRWSTRRSRSTGTTRRWRGCGTWIGTWRREGETARSRSGRSSRRKASR